MRHDLFDIIVNAIGNGPLLSRVRRYSGNLCLAFYPNKPYHIWLQSHPIQELVVQMENEQRIYCYSYRGSAGKKKCKGCNKRDWEYVLREIPIYFSFQKLWRSVSQCFSIFILLAPVLTSLLVISAELKIRHHSLSACTNPICVLVSLSVTNPITDNSILLPIHPLQLKSMLVF